MLLDPRQVQGGADTQGSDGVVYIKKITQSVDLASVAANIVAYQDVTVVGVLVGDIVIVEPDADLSAIVGLVGARVSAVNTVRLAFANPTAGALDATAINFIFTVIRLKAL